MLFKVNNGVYIDGDHYPITLVEMHMCSEKSRHASFSQKEGVIRQSEWCVNKKSEQLAKPYCLNTAGIFTCVCDRGCRWIAWVCVNCMDVDASVSFSVNGVPHGRGPCSAWRYFKLSWQFYSETPVLGMMESNTIYWRRVDGSS